MLNYLRNTTYTEENAVVGCEQVGKNGLYTSAKSCSIQPNEKYYLKDIAQIIAEDALHNQIGDQVLYQVNAERSKYYYY